MDVSRREPWVRAGVLGFLLALLVSGGVAVERLDGGEGRVALILNLATIAATFAVAVWTRRLARTSPQRPLAAAQLVGLVLGVGAVHATIALAWHPGVALRETPAQLVNDAALGFGLLLLVWSYVARSRAVRLVAPLAAFALIVGYRATAPLWHVDAIEFRALTIQQFVFSQLVATAAGLLVLDWIRPAAPRR